MGSLNQSSWLDSEQILLLISNEMFEAKMKMSLLSHKKGSSSGNIGRQLYSQAKPKKIPSIIIVLIITVFPQIIGRGDFSVFASKGSDYFNFVIISNIAHWKWCPKYFILLSQ